MGLDSSFSFPSADSEATDLVPGSPRAVLISNRRPSALPGSHRLVWFLPRYDTRSTRGPLGFLAQSPGLSLLVTALASGLFALVDCQIAPRNGALSGMPLDYTSTALNIESGIGIPGSIGLLRCCSLDGERLCLHAHHGETPVMTIQLWMLRRRSPPSWSSFWSWERVELPPCLRNSISRLPVSGPP